MKEVDIYEAYDALKPESLNFIISIDENGKPFGMANAWSMKCSREPALYAICLSKKGYTHKLIQQSKEFVVAVANKDLEEALVYFGSNHGDEVDKFAETGLETMPAKSIKSPLIKKASFNFECVVEKEVEAGSHILFIGKILHSYVDLDKGVLIGKRKVDEKRVFEEV
jgi:flavin reductase (DIM6/NTAB) family NADH-FMN oxidoreductase RutF